MRIEREITMLAYQIRRPRRPLARLSQRRSAIAPDGRRLASRSGKRLGTPERAAGGTTAGRSGRPCSRTGSTSLIPPVSSRVHQCRRAACLERFPSRDARPPLLRRRDRRPSRQADEIPSGGCVRKSGRLRPDPASTASSVRFADRPVLRSGKSGEVSLPRRVPSPRSGCVNYHWRFEPRSGCRDESATTRRAGGRVASRKPISGAQRPQPATR